MGSNQDILISVRDSLRSAGLRHLLSNVLGVEAHCLDISPLGDPLSTVGERDLYLVDAVSLVSQLPFLLPRKGRVVVVGEAIGDKSQFRHLDTSLSESELVERLNELLGGEGQKQASQTHQQLSKRELQLLKLVVEGKTSKEIAQLLNISVNTVLTHRKNITAKLGIKSVSGLSFYAIMNGIAGD